ncbi:ABC transporter ATP-binding protein [Haladaptatus pallidirubidus]|uniref:ATP-binding cassette domain-containing protein n=1 Tax=Haladaptatus pallidirubidus TaxID=1008152 RepID=A0AAV3UB84_9EURY|nr:ABC transporter ATP-binding protein [Haladaptatus pallidirubidus]
MSLLEVNDLRVRYDAGDKQVHAVDGVTFNVNHGETYGLVGESGCGKTTLAKSLIHLLDSNGYVESGEIWFDGTLPEWEDENGNARQEIINDDRYPVRADGKTDLAKLDNQQIRDVRWRDIALIPQSAMNALNPVYKVGDQITEAILRHEPGTSVEEADARARDLIERVGIEPDRADDYAHQFSGGMKQRAVIAMAMACNPDLLIADEPTTALDVIIQDRILEELEALQEEFNVAILVVSHDVSVMAEICDKLAVMYGGKMMESGPMGEVLNNAANPYTLGLKNSFPTVEEAQQELISIPGSPPTLLDPNDGCRFAPRCPFVVDECHSAHPPGYDVEKAGGGRRTEAISPDVHRSACYRIDELETMRTEAKKEKTWHQNTTQTH